MGTNDARAVDYSQRRQPQAAVEPLRHWFAENLANHFFARYAY
jgi:hypothetical protein